VLPLSAVFVAMVVVNSLCIGYIQLSLLQSFRPFVIAFSLLTTFVLLGESITKMDNNEWSLLTHNSAVLTVILLPAVFISGEYDLLITAEDIGGWGFFKHIIENGLVGGFLANLALFVLIKHTSALTACIFGILRSCTQMILSYLIWGDSFSRTNGTGLVLVITGFYWFYNVRKNCMRDSNSNIIPLPIGFENIKHR